MAGDERRGRRRGAGVRRQRREPRGYEGGHIIAATVGLLVRHRRAHIGARDVECRGFVIAASIVVVRWKSMRESPVSRTLKTHKGHKSIYPCSGF